MRLCQKCWKNLKDEPANAVGKKDKGYYLLCNNCLKIENVQKLINDNNWEVILDKPRLKDLRNKELIDYPGIGEKCNESNDV